MLEHELRNALDLQSGGQTCNSDAHVPEYSRSGQGHSVAMAIKDPNCVNAFPVLKMDALTGGKLLCCLHELLGKFVEFLFGRRRLRSPR